MSEPGLQSDALTARQIPFTTGHRPAYDLRTLAASLPPKKRTGGPLIHPGDGWIELPFRGLDQSLFLEDAPLASGVMTQMTLVLLDDAPDAGQDPRLSLSLHPRSVTLAVEPYATQEWFGVHAAWAETEIGQSIIRHRWMLAAGRGVWVDVRAEFSGYRSPALSRLVESAAASVAPVPPIPPTELTGVFRDTVALLDRWRSESDRPVQPVGVPDSPVASAGPRLNRQEWSVVTWSDGHVAPQGLGGRMSVTQERPHEWVLEPTGPGAPTGSTLSYPADQGPELALHLAGFRAMPPGPVVSGIPLADLSRRFASDRTPLPPGARITAQDPQTAVPADLLQQWWAAPWTGWGLRPAQGAGSGDLATSWSFGALTVAGFGHFRWTADHDSDDRLLVRPLDGLEAYRVLTSLFGPATDR
ncbi:hypothetical protein GCM10010977_17780 [Citricoccus zhacaiensis]|uniref:DUF2169 domain-containing protein n=1 Tax=Citricoccus zhacaiensis TaxID=489142 RepID=A0ABQ2LZH4_9MICC|nr:hypothetical protein [Citricoccus zhacaiensis]GGO45314.1 hypothetical protein GCM10010977_17780 [Citricoccus zhacaiensis]